MSSSLIPERPLLISPTLAATIGLEETVMLHVLSEMKLRFPVSLRDNLRWLEVNLETLSDAMPFWNIADIMRIQQSLLEKGLVQVDGGDSQKGYFKIAINETGLSRKAAGAETSAAPRRQKTRHRVLLMLHPHMLQRHKFHWHKQQHLKHHRLTLSIRHRAAARPRRFQITGSPVKIFTSFAAGEIFPEILLMSMSDCLSSVSRKGARHSIPGTTLFINTSCGNGSSVAAIVA